MSPFKTLRFAVLALSIFTCNCNTVLAYHPKQVVATDSRISTFLYDENSIYPVTFGIGYQSVIKFDSEEEIELIAVGKPYHWKINPIDKRVFIQPTNSNTQTNMAILTNKRFYLFELNSGDASDENSQNIMYLARFNYPDKDTEQKYISDNELDNMTLEERVIAPFENLANDISEGIDVQLDTINTKYSYQGEKSSITPVEIFDNKHRTYIKFGQKTKIANIAIHKVNRSGKAGKKLKIKHNNSGFVTVDGVHPRLLVKNKSNSIILFNDISDSNSEEVNILTNKPRNNRQDSAKSSNQILGKKSYDPTKLDINIDKLNRMKAKLRASKSREKASFGAEFREVESMKASESELMRAKFNSLNSMRKR